MLPYAYIRNLRLNLEKKGDKFFFSFPKTRKVRKNDLTNEKKNICNLNFRLNLMVHTIKLSLKYQLYLQ